MRKRSRHEYGYVVAPSRRSRLRPKHTVQPAKVSSRKHTNVIQNPVPTLVSRSLGHITHIHVHIRIRIPNTE